MTGGLRTRATLGRYATVFVVACVVLAAAGAFVAYEAHGTPNTTTETRTVDEWRLSGSFAHQAAVRANANTTAFEPGSTVENRSTYFAPVMPELEGAFAVGYAGEGAPVDVRVTQRVVVRSVEPTAGEEGATVYWRETRPLDATRTTLQPGDRARVPFAVNVSETFERARNESDRLGDPGRIEARVVVDVAAVRRTDDGTNRTVSFVLPIENDGGLYHVRDGSRTARFNQSTTVTVADPPGPMRAYGGPIAVVGGLGGAVALAVARRRDVVGVTPTERAYLDYRDDRADYADWITTATLPASALDRQRVVVDSLAGLADVAIDAGERVVHDETRDAYVVVHGDYAYTFQPPDDPHDADADGEFEALDADGEFEAVAADREVDANADGRHDHGDGDPMFSFDDASANAVDAVLDDPATFDEDATSEASGED